MKMIKNIIILNNDHNNFSTKWNKVILVLKLLVNSGIFWTITIQIKFKIHYSGSREALASFVAGL